MPHPLVQGRVQRAAGGGVPKEGGCGPELRQADSVAVAERVLSRNCDPRPENDCSDDSLRRGEENFERGVRVSDVVWSAHGFAAATSARRFPATDLYSLRAGLVSIFHAPVGGASGESGVLCAEFLPVRLSAANSERFAGLQSVDGQAGDVLCLELQCFWCSGEKRKRRIVHGNDVFYAKEANRVSRFPRTHCEKIADGKHRYIGFI